MKQFKFHKLNTITQAIPLGIAIILLFISFFELIGEDGSRLNKICKIIAYGIIALHFAQTLWHKYYVSYNKKGMTIRLNRNLLQERTFQFKHLDSIEEKNGVVSFNYRNQPEEIHLKEFKQEDINKVVQILNKSGNI